MLQCSNQSPSGALGLVSASVGAFPNQKECACANSDRRSRRSRAIGVTGRPCCRPRRRRRPRAGAIGSSHRGDRLRVESRRLAHVHLRAEACCRCRPRWSSCCMAAPSRPPSYDLGAGWSTLAERHGFVLLLPEQPRRTIRRPASTGSCPSDTARDRGEVLSIRQMIEKTIGAHDIDRGRVFVTGLSAGGAMTAAMLATYPEVFAAGAIIAGLPYGAAGNVQQAFESMFQGPRAQRGRMGRSGARGASRHRGPWPRVSIWHGDADATVVPLNAEGPGAAMDRPARHRHCAAARQGRRLSAPGVAPRRDRPGRVPHHHRHGAWHAAVDRRRGLRQGRAVSARGGDFVVLPHREILRADGRRAMRARRPARDATIVMAPPLADDVEVIPDERVEILDRDDRCEIRRCRPAGST